MTEVEKYIAAMSTGQQAEFERVRKIVDKIVPDTELTISYGILAFKHRKKPLIYFGAFAQHMSIFPASDAMVKELGEDLGKFRTSKGTLQFTESNPIPEPLLRSIVKHRLNSITTKS